MSDLCRQMQPLPAGLQVDFIRMSRWVPHLCRAQAILRQQPTCSSAALGCSYIGTQSQGKVAQTLQSKVPLAGRHVLVVRPLRRPRFGIASAFQLRSLPSPAFHGLR